MSPSALPRENGRQRARRAWGSILVLAALSAVLILVLSPRGSPGAQAARLGAVVVRVNRVGYAPGETKLVYALTSRPVVALAYAVRDASGTLIAGTSRIRCPALNRRWQGCHVLDLSRLRRPGTYRIRVGRSLSPPLRIAAGAQLYAGPAAGAITFLQTQRDGTQLIPGALHRRPAHRNDRDASVYMAPRYRGSTLVSPLFRTSQRVNVGGGWFDSGDYLKFAGTASFTDVALLFTLREYGAHLPAKRALAAEARYGTDWLLRLWDQRRRVLLMQVGLGDGNGGTVLGDHDVWRLPQVDDRLRDPSLRYLARRPVFAANASGKPVSPNLAGRVAAAFALCAQVFRTTDPAYAHRCLLAGQTLYDAAAQRWRGPLAGSVPASYYPEPQWRDDMELAAIELYLATLRIRSPDLPHREPFDFLERASAFADGYLSSGLAGEDSLNLYDVAPLAHYDLFRAMVATGNTNDLYVNTSDLLADLRDQLMLATHLARTGALGLADPATPDDTVSHAFGYAVEARLLGALTGRRTFASLAARELGWVLGANPWGYSFVVGVGTRFPRCLAHQVANLSGSLSGRGALLTGAVVAGPVGGRELTGLGAPDGFRRCSADPSGLAVFDGRGLAFRDDVRSFASSEPSDDLAGLSLLAFAQEAAGLPRAPRLTIPR